MDDICHRCVERAVPLHTTIGDRHWLVLPLAGREAVGGLLIAVARIAAFPVVDQSKVPNDGPLRLILDSVEQGVCVLDAGGRITLYNKRLLEVLGVPEALLAGHPTQGDVIRFQASRGDLDALGVDTEDRITQVASEMQKATGPIRYERSGRDGRRIDVLITPLPGGGQIRTFTDVTARREMERRSKANDGLLREILANLDAEITVFDANEAFVLGNRRFHERNPHFPPDSELAGRTYADLVRLSVTAGAVADPRAKKDPEDYVARRTVEWREAKETSYEHRPETGRWNLVKTHRTSTGLAIQFLFDISEQKRVEEELATKTALLELALENMGDGLALYDRDINIIIHNRQMREFFGFPEELLQGKATAERMARFLAIRGRYGGGDPGVQVERVLVGFRKRDRHTYEHTLPDGRIIQVHHNPLPDGTLIRRYTDVTAQKRAEAEVVAKTALLETTLENMGDGIAVFDRDLNILLHNRQMRVHFELPDDLMHGPVVSAERVIRTMARWGRYGPGDPNEQAQRLINGLRNPEAGVYELEGPEGRVISVLHRPLPDGRLVRRYTDITERRRAEAEIASKTALLAATLESIRDGISMLDEDLNIIATNRLLTQIFKLPADYFASLPMHIFRVLKFLAERGDYGPGDVDVIVERRLAGFRKREPWTTELAMFDRIIEIHHNPLADGRLLRSYADVTERKKLESDLKEAREPKR